VIDLYPILYISIFILPREYIYRGSKNDDNNNNNNKSANCLRKAQCTTRGSLILPLNMTSDLDMVKVRPNASKGRYLLRHDWDVRSVDFGASVSRWSRDIPAPRLGVVGKCLGLGLKGLVHITARHPYARTHQTVCSNWTTKTFGDLTLCRHYPNNLLYENLAPYSHLVRPRCSQIDWFSGDAVWSTSFC